MNYPKIVERRPPCAEHQEHVDPSTAAVLAKIPISQAEPQRHRCAACAYELGIEEGKRRALASIAAHLGDVVKASR